MSKQREEIRITKVDGGFTVKHSPAASSYDEQVAGVSEYAFSTITDLVNYLINTQPDV